VRQTIFDPLCAFVTLRLCVKKFPFTVQEGLITGFALIRCDRKRDLSGFVWLGTEYANLIVECFNHFDDWRLIADKWKMKIS
jgi:hypothetical protein